MDKLYNWTAKRSGAALTIFGRDATGNNRRVTDVIEVSGSAGQPTIALTRGGKQYSLV